MKTVAAFLIAAVVAKDKGKEKGLTKRRFSTTYNIEYGLEGTDVVVGYSVTQLTGQTKERIFSSTNVLYQDALSEADQDLVEAGTYQGDALMSGFTGKWINGGSDGPDGESMLTQECSAAGSDEVVEDESCGWVEVEPAKYEFKGYVSIVGEAKRPMDVAGYELKYGAYTLHTSYLIKHDSSYPPDNEDDQKGSYFVDTELLEPAESGAFAALATGVTMIMASLAF